MDKKVFFFDLDHTLWDFERNSTEALQELFEERNLSQRIGLKAEDFIARYQVRNFECWEEYRKGFMPQAVLRTERFRRAFREFEHENEDDIHFFAEEYVKRSPEKTHLFPGAIEVLEGLKSRYHLAIITNGFEDVQHRKLKNTQLDQYFQKVITSEMAGVKKPDPKIFQFALDAMKSTGPEAIMIGDEPEIDLIEASRQGFRTVWFNPKNKESEFKPTYTTTELTNLLDWF